MPLEAKHGLVRRHSASVVNDLDKRTSRVLDDHGNLVRTGIDGILH